MCSQRATGMAEKSKMASFTQEVVSAGCWLRFLLGHRGPPAPPPLLSSIILFLRNKWRMNGRKKEGREGGGERRVGKGKEGRKKKKKRRALHSPCFPSPSLLSSNLSLPFSPHLPFLLLFPPFCPWNHDASPRCPFSTTAFFSLWEWWPQVAHNWGPLWA